MIVLITGSDGFIGKNICARLRNDPNFKILKFTRQNTEQDLRSMIDAADAILHLAAENRPSNPVEFLNVNIGLTKKICELVEESKKNIKFVFTSSTQVALKNPYGSSKLAAEEVIKSFSLGLSNPSIIIRLPGVFGKWCKPNYNSVVATFCHNIARDLPINIVNPHASIHLAYIDDVVDACLDALQTQRQAFEIKEISTINEVTIQELANHIFSFHEKRGELFIPDIDTYFKSALYSTYVSYLPKTQFHYNVPIHKDERGIFVEMLKSPNLGQFSFLTCAPGSTRGGHYHDSKIEKFLVAKGKARFEFNNIQSGEKLSIETDSSHPSIVESIPGWAHNITNIGNNELIVLLWANEIFNRDRPDTFTYKV